MYVYVYGSVSLIHGSNKFTSPKSVTHVVPSWALHRRPSVHMRHQTCLLCDAAGMSAVEHTRHVGRVRCRTCLLRHTADMSTVGHSRYVCCVPQQTCVLRDTAAMPAM